MVKAQVLTFVRSDSTSPWELSTQHEVFGIGDLLNPYVKTLDRKISVVMSFEKLPTQKVLTFEKARELKTKVTYRTKHPYRIIEIDKELLKNIGIPENSTNLYIKIIKP